MSKVLKPSNFGLALVLAWSFCTITGANGNSAPFTDVVYFGAFSLSLAMLAAYVHVRPVSASTFSSSDIISAIAVIASTLLLCCPALQGDTASMVIGAVLGGFGGSWLCTRLGSAYSLIKIQQAAPLVLLNMAAAAPIKLFIDALPTIPRTVALLIVVAAAFWCARRSVDCIPASDEPNRFFNKRTVNPLWHLGIGVGLFSFTMGIVQVTVVEAAPIPFGEFSILLHGCEIVLAAGTYIWIASLGNDLSFSKIWRIVLLLLASALILLPSIGGYASDFLYALIGTSRTFLVAFLTMALCDISRHSIFKPMGLFALGFTAYTLPYFIGLLAGRLVPPVIAQSSLTVSALAILLIFVTLFLIDESSVANNMLFTDLNDPDGERARHLARIQHSLDTLEVEARRGSADAEPETALDGAVASVDDGTPNGAGAALKPAADGAREGDSPTRTRSQRDKLTAQCEIAAEKFGLTPREREVLILFAHGRSKAYIADAFIISENTVRGHTKRLYAKLNVHNRQELLDRVQSMPLRRGQRL